MFQKRQTKGCSFVWARRQKKPKMSPYRYASETYKTASKWKSEVKHTLKQRLQSALQKTYKIKNWLLRNDK